MDTWVPVTKSELLDLIANQLSNCNQAQLDTWKKYSVKPYKVKIDRYGLTESVYIVALKSNVAMYFEDVEDGFNFSRLSKEGDILEHYCNQDELDIALNKWTEGMEYHNWNLGPAEEIL